MCAARQNRGMVAALHMGAPFKLLASSVHWPRLRMHPCGRREVDIVIALVWVMKEKEKRSGEFSPVAVSPLGHYR